jgi:hypothetical protein
VLSDSSLEDQKKYQLASSLRRDFRLARGKRRNGDVALLVALRLAELNWFMRRDSHGRTKVFCEIGSHVRTKGELDRDRRQTERPAFTFAAAFYGKGKSTNATTVFESTLLGIARLVGSPESFNNKNLSLQAFDPPTYQRSKPPSPALILDAVLRAEVTFPRVRWYAQGKCHQFNGLNLTPPLRTRRLRIRILRSLTQARSRAV